MKTVITFILVSTWILATGCVYNSRQARYQEVPAYSNDVISSSGGYGISDASTYPSSSRTIQGAAAAAQMSASDQELITSVRHQFDRYGDLSGIAPNITVSSLNGTVTLTGSVPSERDRQMIEAMVRNTPGVVALNDQIQVSDLRTSSLSESDRILAGQVRSALDNQPGVASVARNIRVDALNGTVTLSGSVPTSDDRQLIENLVRNTTGVTGVIDNLQVPIEPTGRPEAGRVYSTTGDIFNLHVQGLTDTDRTLAQRILEGLRTDTVLPTLLPVVDIQVSDGKVTLQGTVQNEQQKQTIESAVQRAAGNGNVVDLLRVQALR